MEGARERREFELCRPGEVVGEPEKGEEARWLGLVVPKTEERACDWEFEWEGDVDSARVLGFVGLRCDAPRARVSGDDCDCVLESFAKGPSSSVGGSLPMSIEKPEDAMVYV